MHFSAHRCRAAVKYLQLLYSRIDTLLRESRAIALSVLFFMALNRVVWDVIMWEKKLFLKGFVCANILSSFTLFLRYFKSMY